MYSWGVRLTWFDCKSSLFTHRLLSKFGRGRFLTPEESQKEFRAPGERIELTTLRVAELARRRLLGRLVLQ